MIRADDFLTALPQPQAIDLRGPRRSLADDVREIYPSHWFHDLRHDDDAEGFTWTHDIDQTNLAQPAGRWADDDMEIDDGI